MLRPRIRPTLLMMALLANFAFLAPRYSAQTLAPEAYSITEIDSRFVQGMTVKIDRDGPKALVDLSYPPIADNPKGYHHRSLWDFAAREVYIWDLLDTSRPCGLQTFSGDWANDPFLTSAQMTADLAGQSPVESGNEAVNGIPTKVVRVTVPEQGTGTLWIERKFGLLVKSEWVPKNGKRVVLIEVKEFSLSKPLASLFELPSACKNAKVTGSVHTEGGKSEAVSKLSVGTETPGPQPCKPGFVWREAFDGDYVCVTPSTRAQVLADYAEAPKRVVGHFENGRDNLLKRT